MTATLEVGVAGVGVFTADYPDATCWLRRPPSGEPGRPKGAALDRRSRGRSSMLTKALADVYFEAVADAALDPAEVSAVFGSALGEVGTMLGLLNQMWRDHEEPSPMGFALSVHNAASGVVSIAKVNRGFTTSLGADHDTPAMALVEAIGLVFGSGLPVLVVCGDEQTPKALVADEEAWELATAAVALVPVDRGYRGPRIRGPFKGRPTIAPVDAPPMVTRNPQVGLLDLIDAAGSQRSGVLALDRGGGSGWCMEVLCTDA